MINSKRIVGLMVCALGVTASPCSALPPSYLVTPMGPLPSGNTSIPMGMSGNGLVAGRGSPSYGRNKAFYWDGSSMTNLGTLGGSESQAWDVNTNGLVVGWSETLDGRQAFTWTATDGLSPIVDEHSRRSEAYGVNEHGQVVGYYRTESDEFHPFLWSQADGMRDLGTLGYPGSPDHQYSRAYDVNDHGVVVGFSAEPFLWDQDGGMQGLGTLGGSYGSAWAINNDNQVVGRVRNAAGDWRAFLWDQGTMTDLGTLGGNWSYAFDINDHGLIVGEAWDAGGTARAVVWENGTIFALEDLVPDDAPFGRIVVALAINNDGEIAVEAMVGASARGFLLTPIPEPATLALLSVGGLAMLRRRRS